MIDRIVNKLSHEPVLTICVTIIAVSVILTGDLGTDELAVACAAVARQFVSPLD
jgi:hypothetical protein